MAASIGRASFLSRSNLFRQILKRTFPRCATNCMTSENHLRVIQYQQYSYIGTTGAVNSPQTIRNVRFQSSTQMTDHKCWSCNHVHSSYTYVCEKCGKLQEPKEDPTHFDVMGIHQSFRVDTSSLTQKFRELQKIFHPDRFTNKSAVSLQHVLGVEILNSRST